MTAQIICNDEKLRKMIDRTLGYYGMSAALHADFSSVSPDKEPCAIIGNHGGDQAEMMNFTLPVRIGAVLDWVCHVNERQPLDMPDLVNMGLYNMKPARLELLTASGEGEAIRLTEKERDILLYLWSVRPDHVDRKTLLHKVWGYAEGIETHTLETHIYRLRQKIEEDPARPAFLVTDEQGYRLT